MLGVRFSSIAEARHGALIQRLSAVSDIVFASQNILLRDSSEAGEPCDGSRTVSLEQGDAEGIERISADHFLVRYRSASGDRAFCRVLAAMSAGEGPSAADPESLAVFALARRLAATDIPILINGPTGTGKEILSRFVHSCSPRAGEQFIAVNCAAMPETMLEAMLFGYQKGSFTGANAASEGFIRAAEGGTLLLDEIAEMPLSLQSKLLRAIQESEVVPLGATMPIKVNVRIIAAANRDLPLEVAEGRFREDLYYRLNVFPLSLPALSERLQDIDILAQTMAIRHSSGREVVPCLSEAAGEVLRGHDWPGNVRELENVIRRALLLSDGGDIIEPSHILFDRGTRPPAEIGERQQSGQVIPLDFSGRGDERLASVKQETETKVILNALRRHEGNRGKTASFLGISERTLRYRLASMRDSGIDVDDQIREAAQCQR